VGQDRAVLGSEGGLSTEKSLERFVQWLISVKKTGMTTGTRVFTGAAAGPAA
jgi:hypothetical protein